MSCPTPGRKATTSKSRKNYKTKSFSGCWTCRARRVKCDEARPACRRCSLSRLDCGGYYVRLRWADADADAAADVDNDAAVHRPRKLIRPPDPECHQLVKPGDMARLLGRCNRSANRRRDATHSFGPFTVFDSTLSRPSSPSSPSQSTPLRSAASTPSVPRRLDLVQISPSQCELVHHWIHYVCINVIVVDPIDNPYRVVYVPFAYEGILSQTTDGSAGRIALFHAMCAVAAESLLSLGAGSSAVTNLRAAEHEHMALRHLQVAITRSSQAQDAYAVIAAILISIMRDSVAGRVTTWRSHVQAALQLLRARQASAVSLVPGDTGRVSIIEEQTICIAVFANLLTSSDFSQVGSCIPDEDSYLLRDNGITKSMLQCVVCINELVGRRRDGAHAADNRHDDGEVARLELQLQMLVPPSPSCFTSHCARREAVLICHYSHLFYYAILLYFHRTIRHTPPTELRDLVDTALSTLERSDELGDEAHGCPLLWPCLVVATECDHEASQSRVLDWFLRKRRHGFASVDMGMDICMRYWKWRDEYSDAASGTSWQEFVKGTTYDVVPL